MNIFILISAISVFLYVCRIASLKHQWEKYPEYKPVSTDITTGISIIVPFRNEKDHIATMLTLLDCQEYPREKLEIIIVNDHSDDGSENTAAAFCKSRVNFHFIHNGENSAGKKSAIRTGMNHASNELVITTDADCSMLPCWAGLFAAFYRETQADMIIGLVDVDTGNNMLERFQEVEFLSLVASGSGAAAGGKPIYGNAASFAFKRGLFFAFDDPMNKTIVSGDDTFFIHTAKKHGKRIRLLKSKNAVVRTACQKTWTEYLNQRTRWVSKSRHYRDRDTLSTAVTVLILNLLLLCSLVLVMLNQNLWLYPLLFLMKVVPDFLFLRSFMDFYNKRLNFIRFLGYSFIYPFMTALFVFAGLTGQFHWKGRAINTR